MENTSILLFKRQEKKYLLDGGQYAALRERLKEYTTEDTFGKYTICNIYFDTNDYSLIRHSLDHPEFKEKLRLRSYGVPSPDQLVFLEIKKKYEGIVYKRRIEIPYATAIAYLERGVMPNVPPNEISTLREIDYFYRSNQLKPRVFLAYDRIALVSNEDKTFRITFDTDIRSREEDLSLSSGDYGDKLLRKDEHLLELKVNCAIPLWLVKILNELKIYPVSFSKYGKVYINNLKNNIKKERGVI